MIFGIIGGYVVCVYVLQLSPEDYQSSILTYVEMTDITSGLIKAAFLASFWLGWVVLRVFIHAVERMVSV